MNGLQNRTRYCESLVVWYATSRFLDASLDRMQTNLGEIYFSTLSAAETPSWSKIGRFLTSYKFRERVLGSRRFIYKLAFPWLSNGRIATNNPATKNRAPLVYTGAVVSRFANIATIGCVLSVGGVQSLREGSILQP